MHGTDVFLINKMRIAQRLAKKAIHSAHNLHFVSEELRSIIERHYGATGGRDFVLPMVFGLERFSQPDSKPRETKRILFVGRLMEVKGVDILIKAFSKFLKIDSLSDYALDIVGDGPELDSLQQLARQEQVEEKITFHGSKQKSEIAGFYRNADLFVLPSRTTTLGEKEGLGLVVLEAMMSGVPVIGTNCGGIKETIEHGKTGIIVPENDVNALHLAMVDLIQDVGKREQFSHHAHAEVARKYSSESLVTAMKQWYGVDWVGPQTQSTKVPTIVGKALTVVIVLVSFWFVWQQIQASEIDVVDTLFNSEPIIFLSVLCIFGVVALSPIIWKFLMLGCGTDVSYRMCFAIWWTTNIAKYVPGKVSLIAGRVYVARRYGKGVVLESFVWELIISISSAVLAGLFLLDLEGISFAAKGVLISIAIASLFPVISPKLTQRVVRKPFALLGRGEWNEETSMTRRIYSITLILMMISWLLWGLAHKFILLGLGVDASLLHLIGAFSLAWLIGFSAFFLPAGLGAREGVFTVNLTLFIASGVAGILVILSRLINIVAEVITFGIGTLMFSKEEFEQE